MQKHISGEAAQTSTHPFQYCHGNGRRKKQKPISPGTLRSMRKLQRKVHLHTWLFNFIFQLDGLIWVQMPPTSLQRTRLPLRLTRTCALGDAHEIAAGTRSMSLSSMSTGHKTTSPNPLTISARYKLASVLLVFFCSLSLLSLN